MNFQRDQVLFRSRQYLVRMLYPNWGRLWLFVCGVLALFVYNEFLVYYLVLLNCSWPQLDQSKADFVFSAGRQGNLRAMFLADTHLLGYRNGHWFDRLRREWQMERAFQTLMTLHSPDVVFVLGDVLDEGKWCSDAEFQDHVSRFQRMFRHSDDTDLQVIVGNHDIGFHYMVDEHKLRRFTSAFRAPSVRMEKIKGNIFVMVNSMALEGDDCSMCVQAERELDEISSSLNCAQGFYDVECSYDDSFEYTRPILLQHYPMYRPSDSNCSGPDGPPDNIRYERFQETFDCLSKEASKKLMTQIQPRLIISGHTHHGCFRVHADGTPEWTIPSFNWRNKNNPSILLANINNNNVAISKCFLPEEGTLYNVYIGGAFLLFLYLVFPRRFIVQSISRKTL